MLFGGIIIKRERKKENPRNIKNFRADFSTAESALQIRRKECSQRISE